MSELVEELKVLGVLKWLYYRWLYQPHMRFAHRYGWHYAPPTTMVDGSILEWCHWCGLRQINSPLHAEAIRNAAREASE